MERLATYQKGQLAEYQWALKEDRKSYARLAQELRSAQAAIRAAAAQQRGSGGLPPTWHLPGGTSSARSAHTLPAHARPMAAAAVGQGQDSASSGVRLLQGSSSSSLGSAVPMSAAGAAVDGEAGRCGAGRGGVGPKYTSSAFSRTVGSRQVAGAQGQASTAPIAQLAAGTQVAAGAARFQRNSSTANSGSFVRRVYNIVRSPSSGEAPAAPARVSDGGPDGDVSVALASAGRCTSPSSDKSSGSSRWWRKLSR
jgi:hypothetical protein